MGIAEEMKKDEELRKAVEILRKKGYSGRYIYIPRTTKRGEKREVVKRMLAQGMRPMEVAEKAGVSLAYVYVVKHTEGVK